MHRSVVGPWPLVVALLGGCYPVPIVRVPAASDPGARKDPGEHASAVTVATRPAVAGHASGHNLIVLVDGTDSGPRERSNVYKLHERIVAEGRPDVLSFYIEGAGVGFKPIGSATGGVSTTG